jgi:hypothetical protein
MKNKVVLFHENGARIITTDDVSHFQGMKNCVINPDLSEVAGIPPHCWRLQDTRVVGAAENEQAGAITPSITEHKITFDSTYIHPHMRSHFKKAILCSALVSGVVSAFVVFISHFHH